jgi:hypothetical protein
MFQSSSNAVGKQLNLLRRELDYLRTEFSVDRQKRDGSDVERGNGGTGETVTSDGNRGGTVESEREGEVRNRGGDGAAPSDHLLPPLRAGLEGKKFTSVETICSLCTIFLEGFFCYYRWRTLERFSSKFILLVLGLSIVILKALVISEVQSNYKDISSVLKSEEGLLAKAFLFLIHGAFTLVVGFTVLDRDQTIEIKVIELLASLGFFLMLYFPLNGKYNARHHYTSIGMGVIGCGIVALEKLAKNSAHNNMIWVLVGLAVTSLVVHVCIKRRFYNFAVICEVLGFEALILLLLL